jgi:ribosome maturation factor RimP
MDRQAVVTELTVIIEDYLKDQGLDFVDLIYRYEGRDLFLRILVDRPEGGVTLDECSRINREIGDILEEKDIIQAKFILEVSSPGIDRPLKTKSDFSRCINRKVRFFLGEPVNGKIEWEGLISKTEDDRVYVDVEGDIIEIPLVKINKAKQVIE